MLLEPQRSNPRQDIAQPPPPKKRPRQAMEDSTGAWDHSGGSWGGHCGDRLTRQALQAEIISLGGHGGGPARKAPQSEVSSLGGCRGCLTKQALQAQLRRVALHLRPTPYARASSFVARAACHGLVWPSMATAACAWLSLAADFEGQGVCNDNVRAACMAVARAERRELEAARAHALMQLGASDRQGRLCDTCLAFGG